LESDAKYGNSSTPRFSICITNFDSGRTIKRSLESVVSQLHGSDFELIVVDNESRDDSLDYLKALAQKGIVKKLLVTSCSRGKGRHLAYEASSAPYLLSNIDTDVVYNELLPRVLDLYMRRFRGKVLSVYGMMILSRRAADELGGWRDLDRHEDNDLAVRAFEKGLHAQDLSISVVAQHLKNPGSVLRRWRESYVNFRDWFRIGMRRSDLNAGELMHPSVLIAWILYRFHTTYPNPKFREWYAVWKSGHVYGAAS
jgi:glycosyltransferase involved in cell wall biosynthesis